VKGETKKKILVIVAHPDDETIWLGGLLLRNRNNWNTTIISLCRANDFDRAPKFKKVCEIYQAKSFISNLDDSESGDYKKISYEDIENRILSFVDKIDYDYIFTHGKNGEYGHIRHKEIHNAVIRMISEGKLYAEKIFLFSYNARREFANYNPNADKLIKLNSVEVLRKKEIIENVYGFTRGGFEEKSCNQIESFDLVK
jgi:LmbE family N-acetylglucosaminyl deacetylase